LNTDGCCGEKTEAVPALGERDLARAGGLNNAEETACGAGAELLIQHSHA